MKTSPRTGKPDAERIAERITAAVMEHRLQPGTKLVEERLASAFGVSRTKIRQALTLLANEGLVKQHPNRGAFIASPSVQEAIDLFAARRLLEPAVVRNVIARAEAEDIARLRAHLELEHAARARSDRRAMIKLSGEFHTVLARLCSNTFIAKMMDELCPLTSLIIALYDSPNAAACPEDEHAQIVRAIERRDEAKAVELTLTHLAHVEGALRLAPPERQEIDWDALFA